MQWVYNDGGRADAGYKGNTRDCVARAIAIAAELPYQQVYDMLNAAAKKERTGTRKTKISNARTGVFKGTIKRVMRELGFEWVPCMKIGEGCTVHLRSEELPSGRLVVSLSKHTAAVIDGVLHDTYDCSRCGQRCVYGYYYKPKK